MSKTSVYKKSPKLKAKCTFINVIEEWVSKLSAHECREKLHDVVQKHNYAVLIFIAHFQTC